MKIQLLPFGIARDIMGSPCPAVEVPEPATVKDLKALLYATYPRFQGLTHLFIAVNAQYAHDDVILSANDEIALIPPVSGG